MTRYFGAEWLGYSAVALGVAGQLDAPLGLQHLSSAGLNTPRELQQLSSVGLGTPRELELRSS